MQEDEEKLRDDVETARAEQAALQAELERLQQERDQQLTAEAAYHEMHNRSEIRRQIVGDEALRIGQLIVRCQVEVQRLQDAHMLKDIFHIDVDGLVASINGLRISRSMALHVDWSELNAGLGQIALLTSTLSRLHGVVFRSCVLVPHGSFSKVYTAAKVAYELYGSGAANLGRIFGTGRFEKGLGMLLGCIADLCEHAVTRPRANVPALPPCQTTDMSSNFVASASEGKRLLSNLSWLIQWHIASV